MTLLTVEEYKLLHPTTIDDDALQLLLDAAESDIDARCGPLVDVYPDETITERHDGRFGYLTLRRRASSIVAVTERVDLTDTDLDATDYLLRDDGRSFQRLGLGVNPSDRWLGLVTVEYVPVDNTAERKRTQAALVAADVNYNPGVTSEQVGAWMRQMSQAAGSYAVEREAILASLCGGFDFA
jgi:hypothetical protein